MYVRIYLPQVEPVFFEVHTHIYFIFNVMIFVADFILYRTFIYKHQFPMYGKKAYTSITGTHTSKLKTYEKKNNTAAHMVVSP